MSSPAERYARSRVDSGTQLRAFRQLYDFSFDQFQVDACRALEAGKGVLVAAPTGSGKTVVGEFAIHLALENARKCFYTTPIKALSNQKYAELVDRYGPERVGLLTGDNSINSEAPIVVMTTEVLRNMLYSGSSTLTGLSYVVMDEVHYLADPFRGATWEEVIIHLPESVQLVSLSATVSNAEEFGEWLGTVRGDTEIVVEERRPVPLFQHVMVGRRMYDLFADTGRPDSRPQVNPELARIVRDHWKFARRDDRGPRRGRPQRSNGRRIAFTPTRAQVTEKLEAEGLLPAIVFIFSRQACDAAVLQCMYSGIRLTRPDEAAEIRGYVEQRCANLPEEDLAALGYHEWLEGLERGLAAHHAGMLPTFKECVETLFARGQVKVVFATETLALGINMPARSVVLEKLVKWNGQAHADITPGEYTQLTGRAGRRGIDVEGHGVVLWQPDLEPTAVAGLASTRTYPLRSSFRPSYNMAVNLVRQFGRERARELLESSFAQFQTDRAVVGLASQVRRNEEALDGYREAMECHLGDFMEYATLRRAIKDRENTLARRHRADRRAEVVDSLGRLRPGDVIQVPAGRRAGVAVVLDPGHSAGGDGPRPTVLTVDRRVRRLSLVDFPQPVESLTRLRVPRSFNARNAQDRRDLAATLRQKAPEDGEVRRSRRAPSPAEEDATLHQLRTSMRAHPCHGCAEREDHARWAERFIRLERETESLQRRVEQRSNTIARQFDRVCDVLDELGYLEGNRTTESGDRLARIYAELDLVAAECLRQGIWKGLTPAELAANLSALVYESRTPDDVGPPKLPGGIAREALASVVRIWGDLDALESDFKLDFLREPDLGFAWAAFRWASGATLSEVLDESGLAAGDFVRWIKQVLDFADQVADAAGEGPLRETARATVEAMRRGVVAYASFGSDAD
ncbi:DEAD/DEAH box helicase [Actinopolymorpha alba]|uniref:DEAD/DEAH box helicase n=1 Tax=Actinopolymorpha alba TaxID=533267 RepID=UPI00036B14BB|nr:DEAD/DEAH box helicase [Actinopolymorpha alba]